MKSEALPYWALIFFLILVFLTGGASRADVQSLIILRPAAVIFCGIGLWFLKWKHIKEYRFLFGMTAAIFSLVALHLIPLPASIWGSLPGRNIITEVDKVAELGAVWRPLSMVPSTTWNALYSLFVPLAVLILGVQLSQEERFNLLPVILVLGMLSGFIGILQTISDPQGALYFYKITNNGTAVGLFSNRNHQAIFLATLFPMLAGYACAGVRSEEQAQIRAYIGLAGGTILVPLLLVTGSRAGLIAGLIGIASSFLLYRKPTALVPKKRKGKVIDLRWIFGSVIVLCLGALTYIMSRAEALQRITAPDQSEDLRFKTWGPIFEASWNYFPFGSGIGSFVQVYQMNEPYELLSPSYLNHAHNDWLEVYMTAGFAGLILLAFAVFAYCKVSWFSLSLKFDYKRSSQYIRIGMVVLCIFAFGSIADYPLRTPSIACIFIIAVLWMTGEIGGASKSGGTIKQAKLEIDQRILDQ